MDRARIDQLSGLSERIAGPRIDLQKRQSEEAYNKPSQLDKLWNGTASEEGLKLPTNDVSLDEAKPSENLPVKDDSHQDCHHCNHKVKEYIYVEKPKEMTIEGRPREEFLVRSIRPVPITIQRKPFIASNLRHAGTARAYVAATENKPFGTTHRDWARNHSHQTVLQQHCDFFDTDRDGILWPQDTFIGFHRLGFGIILSLVAVLIIHGNFSYPTNHTWLPDPFFRVYLANIHKDKHGSDTGTYDHEGRFVPQKFEDVFEKYGEGRDYLTLWDVGRMLKGQRCLADPVGWGGAFFEWLATYLMLWPADGRMAKEDIRGIYDGSLFYKIAARRASNKAYGYE